MEGGSKMNILNRVFSKTNIHKKQPASRLSSRISFALVLLLVLVGLLQPASGVAAGSAGLPARADPNPAPPDRVVKLIFIHHSTGENWLRDDYGRLGKALADNNYFVSDTNYGWGPDSIGDRTDIPDWLEWFAGGQTPSVMEAVYNESGQNSEYTRLPSDPGGANEIIVFKSCFPNSALEGNPDDPPDPNGWLTVGHARYVYNQILQYFATRPDKLFIVITAPPLSDPTYAENARAFNNWLVNDWLVENNYSLPNVAVFDFFNILTDKNAHHWVNDGQIEHIVTGRNTLAYPSEDDHPSANGSRRATEEFLPMLNSFYHFWQTGSQASPVMAVPAPLEEANQPANVQPGANPLVPLPPEVVQVLVDFESDGPAWEASWDEATSTQVSCVVEQGTGAQGSAALRIDFSIAAGSWVNCSLFYEEPQDWSAGEWLAFDIQSEQADLPFSVSLFSGGPEARQTYLLNQVTPSLYGEYFNSFTNLWWEFLRVDWEENAGSPFEDTGQVTGLAFGLIGNVDSISTGTIRIDNIRLEKSPSYEGVTEPPSLRKPFACLGSVILPLILVGLAWLVRRR
jgi:hypothetical protein